MGLGSQGPRQAVNNWNPWINSNWLTSALLVERDATSGARRRVHKILRSLDRFLDPYYDDGGCDEGPGYWSRAGGSLFDCLELLHSATGGGIELLRRAAGPRDRPLHLPRRTSRTTGSSTSPTPPRTPLPAGDLVFRYGRRIADERMQAFGAWAA